MDDTDLMPFGKHKGIRMIDVPADYLLWVYDQEWCKGEVKKYIEENIDALRKETDGEDNV